MEEYTNNIVYTVALKILRHVACCQQHYFLMCHCFSTILVRYTIIVLQFCVVYIEE